MLLFAETILGRSGFWGTRASLMIDIVFTAMIIVVPIMGWSIWRVRTGRKFRQHKQIQLVLATILLLAVVLFELEMRLLGWRDRAVDSPFWRDGGMNDPIDYSLMVHLVFAIPTPFLWGTIIFMALRGFPKPPQPSPHSARHRTLGQLGALGMLATSVTGWIFYYLAFAAQ